MENQAEQLNNEGVSFFLKGDFNKAEEIYWKALEVDPNYAATLNNLGMLSLQKKEYKEAEKLFRKALNIKNNGTYFLNLGHALANQNKLDDAEEMYTKSIELIPDSLMSWKSLGSLYQYSKQFHNSIEIWKKIISDMDSGPFFKIQLAKDIIELKEYEEALEILYSISRQENYKDEIWYHIGLIHFFQKNFGLSKEAINNCLVCNPNYLKGRSLLATIHLALMNYKSALTEWEYILNKDPDNSNVRMDKAVTLISLNRNEEAIKDINYILEEKPENYKALFYKAMALIELKSKKDAIKILEELIESETPFRIKAENVLIKLKQLNNEYN